MLCFNLLNFSTGKSRISIHVHGYCYVAMTRIRLLIFFVFHVVFLYSFVYAITFYVDTLYVYSVYFH